MSFAAELKPCPFCGGDELGHTGKKTLAIVCIGCGTTGAHADGSPERSATWDAAYGLWNTRTATIPDPMSDPRVVALVDAAEPFFTYAQSNVDENGWTLGTGSERICDWFGPSDFLALIAALSAITQGPSHER